MENSCGVGEGVHSPVLRDEDTDDWVCSKCNLSLRIIPNVDYCSLVRKNEVAREDLLNLTECKGQSWPLITLVSKVRERIRILENERRSLLSVVSRIRGILGEL